MKILITGGAGFIGSNFILSMLKKYGQKNLYVNLDSLTYAGNLDNLSAINRNKYHVFVKGEITDKKLVDSLFNKYQFDAVVNFAAESHVDRSILDPQIFLKTNILGTETLLSTAKKHWKTGEHWKKGVKFLQVSTDEVYGSLGKKGYFTEKTPLDPHSPYSASKASADMIVRAFNDTYGMPVNITRCSNNYGPFQFPEKLIPLMINNALNHKSLPVYGDGKNVRDWLYVEDHCEAIDLVLKKAKPGTTYNVGGSNERENIFIVKLVLKTLSKLTGDKDINESLITYVKDRLGHDRRYAIDASLIRKDLGWKPKVMFEQGIVKTIKWYLNNKKWLDNVISGTYMSFYQKNYFNRKRIH